MNELFNAEADALCGASRYQRSPERQDKRVGSYSRKLMTRFGDVDLAIPRLRTLPFKTQNVSLDGIFLKCSWGGEVQNISVLVAIGVHQDGYREILGVSEGLREDKESAPSPVAGQLFIERSV